MTPLRDGRARSVAGLAALAIIASGASASAAPRAADPPQATITKEPKAKIKVRGNRTVTATWEFAADGPAAFTCKLTHMGLVRPCKSPITYLGLTKGRYRFTVYATRPTSDRAATRARDEIRVVKRKRGHKGR